MLKGKKNEIHPSLFTGPHVSVFILPCPSPLSMPPEDPSLLPCYPATRRVTHAHPSVPHGLILPSVFLILFPSFSSARAGPNSRTRPPLACSSSSSPPSPILPTQATKVQFLAQVGVPRAHPSIPTLVRPSPSPEQPSPVTQSHHRRRHGPQRRTTPSGHRFPRTTAQIKPRGCTDARASLVSSCSMSFRARLSRRRRHHAAARRGLHARGSAPRCRARRLLPAALAAAPPCPTASHGRVGSSDFYSFDKNL